jgi:agmatinase
MNENAFLHDFDPDGVGAAGSLFGLPFEPENAQLVIIPVPWEVTVSYSAGTANGPATILKASAQVDLYQGDIHEAWRYGIAMLPIPGAIAESSKALRDKAAHYIAELETGRITETSPEAKALLATIDAGCEAMVQWVRTTAQHWRSKGKTVALVGGDHSTPLGLLSALDEEGVPFGILQIDAHSDLRRAYEGFTYSHASIMYNALKLKSIERLVQVGIRDYCSAEAALAHADDRVTTFYYPKLAARRFEGVTWNALVTEMVEACPAKVYVSFDIDALDPKLCPNTGTPVPGGFEFEEVNYLLKALVASGREIIGFDLNEVSPGSAPEALDTNDWDGNVGARLLYRLCNLTGVSKGGLRLTAGMGSAG